MSENTTMIMIDCMGVKGWPKSESGFFFLQRHKLHNCVAFHCLCNQSCNWAAVCNQQKYTHTNLLPANDQSDFLQLFINLQRTDQQRCGHRRARHNANMQRSHQHPLTKPFRLTCSPVSVYARRSRISALVKNFIFRWKSSHVAVAE